MSLRDLRTARGGLALSARILFIVIFLLLVSIPTVFAAPGQFDLVGPGTAAAPGPVVSDTSAVTEIQWERAGSATRYTFQLTYPDGEVLELTNLTPGHNGDALECFTAGSDLCTLEVDGEAVLTQQGAYSWTVFAFDAGGEDTEAGNAPFYFRVGNLPSQFDLIGPGTASAPGPEVTNPSAVTQIQWEESAGADKYTFALTFPDNSVVELADLNDGQELNCDAGTCTLTVAGETVLTQDGAYSWTVFAFNEVGSTEAANAPYYFTVNTPDAPGAFDLIGPGAASAPGPEVTDPSAVTEIQWEESAGADTYTFALTFPDNTVVELADLNAGQELNCASGTCTLTVAGETVLTQLGAYRWTVFAFNEVGSTEAANAPYYFTVNTPDAPDSFSLVAPQSGSSFNTALPAQTPIQWGQSAGADTYRWILQKVSTNTRLDIGTIVDAPNLNDGDELTCADGVCTFVVDASVLDSGQYSWTVFAINADGTVEAANGPFTFTIDLEAGLIENSSFEAVGNNKLPEGWQGSRRGAKVKCNTEGKTIAYSGNCVLNVKNNARLSQNLGESAVVQGDNMTLSAWVEGKKVTAGAVIRLTVKYTDGEKGKLRLEVPTGTYAYQALTQSLNVTKPVAKAKLVISSSAKGRIRIDDLSLTKGAATSSFLPLPPAN